MALSLSPSLSSFSGVFSESWPSSLIVGLAISSSSSSKISKDSSSFLTLLFFPLALTLRGVVVFETREGFLGVAGVRAGAVVSVVIPSFRLTWPKRT